MNGATAMPSWSSTDTTASATMENRVRRRMSCCTPASIRDERPSARRASPISTRSTNQNTNAVRTAGIRFL